MKQPAEELRLVIDGIEVKYRVKRISEIELIPRPYPLWEQPLYQEYGPGPATVRYQIEACVPHALKPERVAEVFAQVSAGYNEPCIVTVRVQSQSNLAKILRIDLLITGKAGVASLPA